MSSRTSCFYNNVVRKLTSVEDRQSLTGGTEILETGGTAFSILGTRRCVVIFLLRGGIALRPKSQPSPGSVLPGEVLSACEKEQRGGGTHSESRVGQEKGRHPRVRLPASLGFIHLDSGGAEGRPRGRRAFAVVGLASACGIGWSRSGGTVSAPVTGMPSAW